MKTKEIIRRRRSVRTFDGNPLRKEDADRIMEFTAEAGNPYDIPIEWFLLSAEKEGLTTPVIVGADTFIAGKMQPVPHAEEAFGYSFEKIVLFAESLGIGTTWIAGTMDRPAFERAIHLADGEVMPCISPLGYPAKKMSLREGMMRKGVKADSRLLSEQLFFKDSFETPLQHADTGELADALEMVRWAPSAVNKQPWRLVIAGNAVHFYEKQSKGYVNASGWDLQKIDIGIAMCHFSRGMEELGKTPKLVLEDPGIPAGQDVRYIATYLI